ncbi:hypothetical protein KI387_029950, partial [Taxus chinensis]
GTGTSFMYYNPKHSKISVCDKRKSFKGFLFGHEWTVQQKENVADTAYQAQILQQTFKSDLVSEVPNVSFQLGNVALKGSINILIAGESTFRQHLAKKN